MPPSRILSSWLCGIACCGVLCAGPPAVISTTGRLITDAGDPITGTQHVTFALWSGADPSSAVLSWREDSIYGADSATGSIYVFGIDSTTGAVTPLPQFTTVIPNGPYALVSLPNNRMLDLNLDGTVNLYATEPGGHLEPILEGAPVASGPGASVVVSPFDSNRWLVIDVGGQALKSFRMSCDDSPAKLTQIANVTLSEVPTGIAQYLADNGNTYVYVPSADQIAIFKSAGLPPAAAEELFVPKLVTIIPATVNPGALTVWSGKLFTGSAGSITGYQIDAGTGQLTPDAASSFAVDGNPLAMAADAQGRLYVSFSDGGQNRIYRSSPDGWVEAGTFGAPGATSITLAAQTYDATSFADDGGANTLRQAITNMNATGGTVRLGSGTYHLQSALPRVTGTGSIVGQGAESTTISGDGQFPGITTASAGGVSISGVTIDGARGTGLAVASGRAVCDGCRISNNSGGGVNVAANSTLACTNCSVAKNSSGLGGGYNIGGSSRAYVCCGSVDSNTGTIGAGVYTNGLTVLEFVNVTGNTATGMCAGVTNRVPAASLIAAGNRIRNNKAATMGGGVCHLQGGTEIFRDNLMADNTPDAIYFDTANPNTVLQGNVIVGNVVGAKVPSGNQTPSALGSVVLLPNGSVVALPGNPLFGACPGDIWSGGACWPPDPGFAVEVQDPGGVKTNSSAVLKAVLRWLGEDFDPSESHGTGAVTIKISATGPGPLSGTTSAVADGNGQATFPVQFSKEGLYLLQATGPSGFSPGFLGIYVSNAGLQLTLVEGNQQTLAAGSRGVTQIVLVTDETGAPLAGVPVRINYDRDSLEVAGWSPMAEAFTDEVGTISLVVFAKGPVGQFPIDLVVPGSSSAHVTLTETVSQQPFITFTSGRDQIVPVNGTFGLPLAIAFIDSGNPKANAAVTLTVDGNAAFPGMSMTAHGMTDGNGLFVAPTLIAGGIPGRVMVTGQSDDSPDVSATAEGTVIPATGSPASVTIVSGNDQSTLPGSAFKEQFCVAVKDAAGNPVPNVRVDFGATEESDGPSCLPDGALLYGALTDQNGLACVPSAKANSTPGGYRLKARVQTPGGPTAEFQLYNGY